MTTNILGHLIRAQIAQHEDNIELLTRLQYSCLPQPQRIIDKFTKAIAKQQRLIKRLRKYI